MQQSGEDQQVRPPVSPFTEETARQKVKAAQDGWNTREDFAEGNKRYDLILDIGGNSSLARLRRTLTPEGTLVIVGGEGGGRWFGGIDRQLRAMMLSPFVSQKLVTFICNENHKDLIVLEELIEAEKLTPVIDRAYPLAEVP